jgi:hypothetical protein
MPPHLAEVYRFLVHHLQRELDRRRSREQELTAALAARRQEATAPRATAGQASPPTAAKAEHKEAELVQLRAQLARAKSDLAEARRRERVNAAALRMELTAEQAGRLVDRLAPLDDGQFEGLLALAEEKLATLKAKRTATAKGD